ncbi:CBS domain-containing protein [Candidatus Aerophobetes bacterium]|uniref:CBS domain-containing protein n=1 Tax=Aerophobetes bacterium TaxID=2030807 RepID=A0A523QHG3_UNCAE|nr:MAG: CBS domain-containing protein [Candidatus Aerophobetes bacterium]
MITYSKAPKIQELGYELKIRQAMNRNLVTVQPKTTMRELREVLRSNRISGVPVTSEGKLVGVICVEDLVNWLMAGAKNCPVREKMSKNVVTLYTDEPLAHAINKLQRYGFFHFPVIERESGKLIGVITREDIIKGLLRKLETDYREEEIRHYRASHIFEDMVADKTSLVFQYYVVGHDFNRAGESASALKKTLKRLGTRPEIVRRVAIAVYEAEMNIVIHARGGEITVEVDSNQIRIKVEDSGPGIPDIEKAMQPGYSTAPEWARELGFGAGMGLDNIKKCADEMNITSALGRATRLEIYVATKRESVSYEVKKTSRGVRPRG